MRKLLDRYLTPVREGEGVAAAGGAEPKTPESVLFPKDTPKPADPPAGDWKEYAPDPAKSDADNATAKAAHDATKPPAKAATDWKEYVKDPAKSDAENAAAKAEHDKTKPADKGEADKVPADGKYALKMPDGIELDAELAAALGPEFQALNLTNGQAQKLVDKYIETQTARAAKQSEGWSKTVTKWVDDAKADKDMGGDKWDGTTMAAQRAVNALGTPALKDYLEASGGGNHPELIRFMAKVGAMIKEDSPAIGGAEGAGKPADPAHVLYKNDAPKG